MTTANKITILRIVLVPVFLVLEYLGNSYAAFAVFVLASLSDLLDGYIARHYHQISVFGKFADPLADKILVLSAMCFLIEAGSIPGWAVAIVIFREFAVSGLRLVAAQKGIVIAAGWSGKVKTATTMVALCVMLLWVRQSIPWIKWLCTALIVLPTVYSGLEYFQQNSSVLKEE